MRVRQRGATLIGMLIIVSIIGLGLYAGIRLVPLYLEYSAVVRAMEQTAKESTSPTPGELRSALARRWSIEDIKSVAVKEIEIRKTADGYTMRAWYRAEAPFIANVSLAVDFDKTVDVAQ